MSLSLPEISSKRSLRRLALLRRRISIGTGSDASSEASEWPLDNMVFEISSVLLADRPSTSRLTRIMNSLAASGNQIMPIRERFSSGPDSIGTCFRQPVERLQVSPVEPNAIGNPLQPILVIETPTVPTVEKLAGDVRRIDHARVFVLELMDAAAAASVTQGFPLAEIESSRRGFSQKWCWSCS